MGWDGLPGPQCLGHAYVRSDGASEKRLGQKLAWPKMGRSFWSRWQEEAYARVDPEQTCVFTADTNSTKSAAMPAPAGCVVQPSHLPLV